MDQPVAFLRDLGSVAKKMLILHTHYATGDIGGERIFNRLPEFIRRRVFKGAKLDYSLSPLTMNEEKWGRWFREHLPGVNSEQMEKRIWASYGNLRSFWLHKKELLQVMKDIGFDIIYEQYDFLEDISKSSYIEDHDRGLFVAIKQNGA